MPTSSSLAEQLATLGIHLPAWPEEPDGGGATGDWIQQGKAYAEVVRLWRAQLRNASESTQGVVDQLLRHLHDTGPSNRLSSDTPLDCTSSPSGKGHRTS